MMRCCNELELVLQGGISSGMADLLIHRGIALKVFASIEFEEVRSAAAAALKIIEQVFRQEDENDE